MTQSRDRSRRRLGRGDTRKALIEGALKLIDDGRSFDSLSLRELTREVGVVPTAFYRHFTDMDELGLALVDEAFAVLRRILQDMRKDTSGGQVPIAVLLKSLIHHAQKHRRRFRLIASQRYSGGALRQQVRREMRLVQGELATDLARLPVCRQWPTEDLQMAAGLLLNNLIEIADELLALARDSKAPRKEQITLAEKQLRLIALGMPHWRGN